MTPSHYVLNLKTTKFICSSIIFHDILNRINPVSKMFQDVDMNVSLALESIENLHQVLQEYRSEANFKNVLKTAIEMSEKLDGEQEFKITIEVRRRKKKHGSLIMSIKTKRPKHQKINSE